MSNKLCPCQVSNWMSFDGWEGASINAQHVRGDRQAAVCASGFAFSEASCECGLSICSCFPTSDFFTQRDGSKIYPRCCVDRQSVLIASIRPLSGYATLRKCPLLVPSLGLFRNTASVNVCVPLSADTCFVSLGQEPGNGSIASKHMFSFIKSASFPK